MKNIRLSLIGFGVVGQGLARLLESKRKLLRDQYDLKVTLVGVGSARSGFIYRQQGLDIPTLLELAAQKKALSEHADSQHWQNALDGLKATEADVMAEVTGTNIQHGEPGISHIRTALTKGMHVVTANKGPGAVAALELLELARVQGVQLRMESTVMAGTPVLSTLREGLAGARLRAVRGILNGTTNYILTAMASGRDYAEVLAEAQRQGYAETDPTADVEGYDVVAKTVILAALGFGHKLRPEQVQRTGITSVTREQVEEAARGGQRIKLVATIEVVQDFADCPLDARVQPIALPLSDPLARVDGVMNAITFQTDTLSEVTIIGPGAGDLQTGQGLLADLIAIARAES